MEAELIEIREFLGSHPPFQLLPLERLAELPKQLQVRYLRRGTAFPPEGVDGALFIVRSGAVELRDNRGELVEKIGEGELYTSFCLDDQPESSFEGRVVEDSLFYLLSCERLDELREEHEEFDAHFTRSVRDRLHRALEVLQESPAGSGLMQVEVAAMISQSPLQVAPGTTIREVAQAMGPAGVTAALIMEGGEVRGLVTDQDLRERCIAAGLPFDSPIESIMTRSLYTITPDTQGFEALIDMARLNVRHLPVVGEEGVVGVLAITDLVRYQSSNAVYLAGDVRIAQSVEEMVTATRSLPELQLQMVNAGASASQIGLAIASVADAITSRLCQLAEERIGPPPVPYVWLAAGSQARREQLINADQDSALIIDNGYDEALHGEWFRRLGDSVCAGMEASGLRYCPGEVMACNQQWRQPLRQWRRYFEDWIDRPLRKSLMYASNFFDMRPIYGEQRLFAELHQQILEQVRNNGIFLAHLAANAVRTRPPLGFFRDFVLTEGGDHVRGVDLKTGGVIPVVDLARIYALAGGISEVGTLERLRRSVVYGTLSERGAGELEGAWILINTLRARHQADAIRRGELVGNSVIPETLSPLDRRHLKDAFGVIKGYQEALAQAYQTDRFF